MYCVTTGYKMSSVQVIFALFFQDIFSSSMVLAYFSKYMIFQVWKMLFPFSRFSMIFPDAGNPVSCLVGLLPCPSNTFVPFSDCSLNIKIFFYILFIFPKTIPLLYLLEEHLLIQSIHPQSNLRRPNLKRKPQHVY